MRKLLISSLLVSNFALADTVTPAYDSIEGWMLNDGTVVVRTWGGTQWIAKPPAHVAADWLWNLRRGPEWLKLIEEDNAGKLKTIRTWPANVWPYQ